ncbi:MAG TPA: CBS domain-containing protein [Pseudonocardiaceae bacterium]|nr:CBS domain-containing protein [Pseudonocardiaceae bacterium]
MTQRAAVADRSRNEDADVERGSAMKVEAILLKKGRSVQTIQQWSTISEVLRRLAGPPRIGALIVTQSNGQIAGMITERDIIRELERHPGQLLDRPVAEVMGRHVPVCSPQDSVEQVMVQMTRRRYRHLPVVDRGQLVGLVSIGDVVKHRIDEIQLESRVLRDLYIASR